MDIEMVKVICDTVYLVAIIWGLVSIINTILTTSAIKSKTSTRF